MKIVAHLPAVCWLALGPGLAIGLFGNTVACGGSPSVSTETPGSGFTMGAGVTETEGFIGSSGGDGATTGQFEPSGSTGGSQGIQYCGVTDGGSPVPCDESDGG